MRHNARREFVKNAFVGTATLGMGVYPLAGRAAALNSKVSLASHPNSVLSSPYFLGLSEGIWTRHDWNITELLVASAGGAAVRTIATGGIPIGDVSATAAFGAWLAGAPIRILTLTITKPTELLFVAKAGSKITRQDLVGKKIGYTTPGSGSHAASALILDRLGLTGKVELVSTGGMREGLALLQRGEIDVASHLESLVKASDKFDTVFRVPDLVPKYAYGAIVASEAFVQKDREHVASFLSARTEAVERVQRDPEAAANAWLKGTRGLELESLLRGVKAINAAQGWITTGWDIEAVQASLRSMELVGAIPSAKTVPLAEMIDQSFIEPERRIKL